MTEKKFTTIEQMEQEAEVLFQRARDLGIDTWKTRAEDQKNH